MSKNKMLSQIVGDNVKNLIKNSIYQTQEKFAWEFGADLRTVSRWLNSGLTNIDTIQEIANFFGTTVASLLEEKNNI